MIETDALLVKEKKTQVSKIFFLFSERALTLCALATHLTCVCELEFIDRVDFDLPNIFRALLKHRQASSRTFGRRDDLHR